MKIDVFAKKVCAAVENGLGKGFYVEARDVRKNNGVILHGMCVRREGMNIAPMVYLDTFLEAYEAGTTFRSIVQSLLEICREDVAGECNNMGFFRSFEKVKDRICYRLIGREKNRELLKDIPYVEFLDLAICFYYAYQGDVLGEGTVMIHNSHMEAWETNAEELFTLASRNTRRLFPWKCCSLADVLKGLADELGDMGNPIVSGDGWPGISMRILSNSKRIDGAACLLYPGVLAQIAEKTGSNFYILPSSVHEIILLPDNGKLISDELKKMISEVNRTQVAAEEVLSDSLYYYDSHKKKVEIV